MFEEGDLIYRYTRADVLRDGVLIDVSQTARETGLCFPVALTRGKSKRQALLDARAECLPGVHAGKGGAV